MAEVKKIRRAGVKLTPKFKVEPEIDNDETISADPEPRKSKLVIKKVSAAPTKFAPRAGVKVTAKTVVKKEAETTAVSPKLRTQQEVDAARKNALDSKLLVGN